MGGGRLWEVVVYQKWSQMEVRLYNQMDDSAVICFTNEIRTKQTNKQHQRTNDGVNKKKEKRLSNYSVLTQKETILKMEVFNTCARKIKIFEDKNERKKGFSWEATNLFIAIFWK